MLTRPKATIMLAPGDVIVIAGKAMQFSAWKTTNTPGVLQITVIDKAQPAGNDTIVFTRHATDLINVIV